MTTGSNSPPEFELKGGNRDRGTRDWTIISLSDTVVRCSQLMPQTGTPTAPNHKMKLN